VGGREGLVGRIGSAAEERADKNIANSEDFGRGKEGEIGGGYWEEADDLGEENGQM
jgi:hypothetical protein